MLAYLVTSLLLLTTAHAYESGAPVTVCSTFRPGHGNEQSSSGAPYTVDVGGSTEYTPGGTLTVTISGASFQGLFLQVHEVGLDVPIGAFSDLAGHTRSMSCLNDADTVTHSSTTAKSNPTFTWNVPSDLTADIEVIATVAVSFSSYYRLLTSSTLTLPGGASPETTPDFIASTPSGEDVVEITTESPDDGSPADGTTQANAGTDDTSTETSDDDASSTSTDPPGNDNGANGVDSTGAQYFLLLLMTLLSLRILTTE